MPRELVATAVRRPAIREYQDAPLEPGEIRVRTEYGAPKHGTELVIGLDPIEARRDRAASTGANFVFDPNAVDAGLEIRESASAGMDVAIETSGSPGALHAAIRGLTFAGTVAVVGWYNEIKG